MEVLTVERSTGAGAISRPEGEEATQHTGSSGEASGGALTNEASASLHPTPPAREGVGSGAALGGQVSLTRATGRLQIDFGEKKGSDGKWAKNPLRAQLADAQLAAAEAANAVARAYWRADADALDRARAAKVDKLNHETWPLPQVNGYRVARAVAPNLNAGSCSAIAQMVRDKWKSERWDILVRTVRSPPFFRRSGTFPLRAQEVAFANVNGTPTISFALLAGAGRRITLQLAPRDEYQQTILVNLASGFAAKQTWLREHPSEKTDDKAIARARRQERAEMVRALPGWRHGDVRVEQDRRKPWKWYLRISYKRMVAATAGVKSVGINRGIFCFLAAVDSGGERWMYAGDDIVAYLKQVQRRRREYQYAWKASGRGRHGHGRARALKPIEHLSGKAERWRETKCSQIAAGFASWCVARSIAVVYMEDFTGIRDGESAAIQQGHPNGIWERVQEWPYYLLGSKITSALEDMGIRVEGKIDPDGISQTCPRCGARDPSYRDLRRWKLVCGKCGHAEHLDQAAAENIRQRGVARGMGSNGTNGNEKIAGL